MTSLNNAFAECFHLQHTAGALDPAQLILELHRPILEVVRHRDESGARRAMLIYFDQLQNALSDLGISDRAIGNQTKGDHAAPADIIGSPQLQPAPVVGRG